MFAGLQLFRVRVVGAWQLWTVVTRVVVLIPELAWVDSKRRGACLPARGVVLVHAAGRVGGRVEPHDGQADRGPVPDPARSDLVPAAPARDAVPSEVDTGADGAAAVAG